MQIKRIIVTNVLLIIQKKESLYYKEIPIENKFKI